MAELVDAADRQAWIAARQAAGWPVLVAVVSDDPLLRSALTSLLAQVGEARVVPQADAEVDLVPLIDCVFLLLLFFMLCGRIAMDQRAEQITVPPTKTSAPPPKLSKAHAKKHGKPLLKYRTLVIQPLMKSRAHVAA